jgi:hypothetical protein
MNKQEHKYNLLVVTIIVIVLLAACGKENLNAPMNLPPTEEATFTPSQQLSKTPIPLKTMEPTLAYWATAQENRFNSTYTQIAETKVAIFELAAQFPQLCGFDTEGVFLSPNGEWIANDCRYSTEEFRVFQTNGHATWIIPLAKLFENYPSDAGSVDALHWSTDGKLLYFTNSACCPDVDTLSTGDTLFVFNLQTGDWRPLIKGHFNFYSFSPDERYLVYILNNQANANSILNLHIRDQNTGEEAPINIGKFEQAGYAVWKQSGLQLALTTQIGNMYDENRKYSLVALDLQKRTSKNIILNSNDPPYVKDWSNDDLLTIQINKTTEYADYYISHYDTLYYDLKTNQFKTVPVSP